jgi:ribosome-associated toxin RatA of RatAB toxin-antitoxin module
MPLLLTALALLAAPGGLTDEELQRALRGEVPVRTETFTKESGKGAGRGLGAIVVERPIAEVWATLARYDDKAQYIPRLEKVTILERRPDLLRARMQVNATVTTEYYTAFFQLDEKERVIHWKLDPSAHDNTLADVDGEYKLFELTPQRTLIVYRTYVDTGRPVPRFIQNHLALRSIPDLLRSIKKRIESGGTWKKR